MDICRRDPNVRRVSAWLALAVVALAGCGAATGRADGPAAAPDRILVGPQGDHGQFVVECGLDRLLADDPIVHPSRPGASHLHQFFGAVNVHASSTYDDLIRSDTTCDQALDTASYWAPALVDGDGEVVAAVGSIAYYRAGPDVDPARVEPFPAGLTMVAGDHTATDERPQPVEAVGWTCDVGPEHHETPPDCTAAGSLRMVVTFPDCWDGEQVSSPTTAEPSRHVAYSTGGACPSSHPVHIPQLQFSVVYPPLDLAEAALTSGSIYGGHADFWNGWDQAKLEREVTSCIGRDVACGIAGATRTFG